MAPPYKPTDVNPRTNPRAAGPPKPEPKKTGGLNLGAPPAPPVKAGKGTKYQHFAAWAQKQGVAGATISDIWYWSQHTPNVDPYLWTSVLKKESGATHLDGNGKIKSSGQAVGIGQIALSWIGQPIPWNKTKKFTGDNNPETGIGNYGVNLRFSATLWGDAVATHGWKQAYLDGYNPNDPNKAKAWADIQKIYGSRPPGNPPIGSPSQGPADTSATAQVGTTVTAPPFHDPYIAGVNGQGKLVTTQDPNKAVQYDGTPMTRSGWMSLKDSLTSHYVSYTGSRPSDKQIENFLYGGQKGKPGVTPQSAHAWSTYTLDQLLSKGKNFTKSPIYKQNAIPIQDAVKDLLPKGAKVPPELLRAAVINQWSATEVAARLRKTAGYTASNEFKGNVATLLNVHDSIMGNATPEDMVAVKDAALAGWTADQYAAYLRQQPTYVHSTEYQSKALGFLGALGLITGSQPVLKSGATPGPGTQQTATQGALPTDPRIKGKQQVTTPLGNLGVTLAG